MQRARVLSATVALLGTAPACESVIGADFGPVETVACGHARPPPRPAVREAGGDGEVIVAITNIDVGDRALPDGTPAYRTIGLDLDNSCSLRGARPTCQGFDWAGTELTDGVDGIDNGGGGLMYVEQDVFNITQFSSPIVNEGIRNGTIAPLAVMRIRGFNLEVVDDSVEVDWYVAQAPGRDKPPALKGNDDWPLSNTTFEQSNLPVPGQPLPPSRYRDPHAYVVDYTLVVTLPSGTPLKLQNVPFATEGMTLILKLAYGLNVAGGPFNVAGGTLGSRVRATELFRRMPQMTQAFGGKSICTNSASYPRIKRYFCRFIESPADGLNHPDAPCDAVSFGMHIETTIVKPGPVVTDSAYETCPADADPGEDSCTIPAPPE